jgi:putative tryptophan/tyrosine transport system substrate-binding protein
MRRRDFIGIAGSAAAWPLAARAQQAASVPRVGMLYPGPQEAVAVRVEAMMNGLRASGYLAPAQIELILRVADGDPARVAPMAAEIVRANVAVIFANGPAVLQAFRSQTTTIPIVAMDLESDPVENANGRQLGASGRERHGFVLGVPGVHDEMAGIAEGNHPPALPGRRPMGSDHRLDAKDGDRASG